MPNIKSAKKRLRQNEKRNAYNTAIKSKIKTSFKKVTQLILEKPTEAKIALNEHFKVIDKAVGKGVIKKNTGARKKSSLSKQVYSTKS